MMDISTFIISWSSFSDNSAGMMGGVLYANRAQATVYNSTFMYNNATLTGGVSLLSESTLTISETNFINNTAADGGSVIMACGGSQVTVTDDLQTAAFGSTCTMYDGNIDDHYNTPTNNYCPNDALTATIGPPNLGFCSLPTFVPSTLSDGGK